MDLRPGSPTPKPSRATSPARRESRDTSRNNSPERPNNSFTEGRPNTGITDHIRHAFTIANRRLSTSQEQLDSSSSTLGNKNEREIVRDSWIQREEERLQWQSNTTSSNSWDNLSSLDDLSQLNIIDTPQNDTSRELIQQPETRAIEKLASQHFKDTGELTLTDWEFLKERISNLPIPYWDKITSLEAEVLSNTPQRSIFRTLISREISSSHSNIPKDETIRNSIKGEFEYCLKEISYYHSNSDTIDYHHVGSVLECLETSSDKLLSTSFSKESIKISLDLCIDIIDGHIKFIKLHRPDLIDNSGEE